MRSIRSRNVVIAVVSVMVAGVGAFVAPTAMAAGTTARAETLPPLKGATSLTTARGLAGALVSAGVVPLPVAPSTVKDGDNHGLTLTFGFPVVGGNPDFDDPTGNLRHSGGVNFVGVDDTKLEIGKFDINLDAGKVFAREVNGDKANLPVLDLDLSKIHVTMPHQRVIVSNIILNLDPAAAAALNSTFGLQLPTDGSLVFGTARVAVTR